MAPNADAKTKKISQSLIHRDPVAPAGTIKGGNAGIGDL
jgi:hypothetical protein